MTKVTDNYEIPTRPASSRPNTGEYARALGERASQPNAAPFANGAAPLRMMHTSVDLRNGKLLENNLRRESDGKVSRMPSIAHRSSDDYRNPVIAEETRGRFREMLSPAGHELFIVHSNGASHAPNIKGRYLDDGFAAYSLQKSYELGRIDKHGGCVLRQIKAGNVNPRKIVAKHILDEKMCRPDAVSCTHYEVEKNARRDRNAERMREVEDRFRPDEERRHHELVKAASEASTNALADALAKVLAVQNTAQAGELAQDSTAPRKRGK